MPSVRCCVPGTSQYYPLSSKLFIRRGSHGTAATVAVAVAAAAATVAALQGTPFVTATSVGGVCLSSRIQIRATPAQTSSKLRKHPRVAHKIAQHQRHNRASNLTQANLFISRTAMPLGLLSNLRHPPGFQVNNSLLHMLLGTHGSKYLHRAWGEIDQVSACDKHLCTQIASELYVYIYLECMCRALEEVRQVARDDGHLYALYMRKIINAMSIYRY